MDRAWIDLLGRVLPEFTINPEWLEDRLCYPIVNDLAFGEPDLVKRGLSVVESLLERSDSDSHDLAKECLETISNSEHAADVEEHMGPAARAAWKSLNGT